MISITGHRYRFCPIKQAVRFRDRSGVPPVRRPAAHLQRAPTYARAGAPRWCGVCCAVRCALDCAPAHTRACASACNMPAKHPQPAGRTPLRGFALVALVALLLSVRPYAAAARAAQLVLCAPARPAEPHAQLTCTRPLP